MFDNNSSLENHSKFRSVLVRKLLYIEINLAFICFYFVRLHKMRKVTIN